MNLLIIASAQSDMDREAPTWFIGMPLPKVVSRISCGGGCRKGRDLKTFY